MRAARWLIGLSVWACASWAQAQASFCSTQTPQTKAEYAAQLACQEHQLWREPFINAQGQLLKFGPMEAERDALSDGTPAWRRVLHYWQNSVGLTDLFRADCRYAVVGRVRQLPDAHGRIQRIRISLGRRAYSLHQSSLCRATQWRISSAQSLKHTVAGW